MTNKWGQYGWAVVQHSGYGYAEDPTFEQGLETRALSLKSEKDKVLKAGGLVFETYSQAEEYCEEEMYKGVDDFTLVPHAPGSFSPQTIDGLRIYAPRDVKATK